MVWSCCHRGWCRAHAGTPTSPRASRSPMKWTNSAESHTNANPHLRHGPTRVSIYIPAVLSHDWIDTRVVRWTEAAAGGTRVHCAVVDAPAVSADLHPRAVGAADCSSGATRRRGCQYLDIGPAVWRHRVRA